MIKWQTKIKKVFQQFTVLVWAMLLSNVVFNITRFMAMPFMAIYFNEKLNLNPSEVGILIGISPLSSLIFSILGGRLGDKFGVHRMYSVALIVPAVSLVGYITVPNYYAIAVFSVFAGIGWAIYNATSNAILAIHAPGSHTEKIFSYNYWGINLGGALGPLIGVLIIGGGNYEIPIGLFAFVLLLIAGIMFFLFRKTKAILQDRNNIEEKKDMDVKGSIYKQLFKDRTLILMTISSFLIYFIEAQDDTNFAQFLNGSFENGVQIFGTLVSMMTGIIVIVQPIMAQYIDRMNNNAAFIFGNGLYFVGFLSLLFLYSQTWSWYFAFALITLGEIIIAPKKQAIMARSAPRHLKATYFSIIYAGGNLAYAIGPWFGGLLLTHVGVNYLLLLLMVVTAFQCYVLIKANRTYERASKSKQTINEA
ncbi:MFS transporter [Salinibacillus xinjiangensis]|nr:MFS transporter [Salinibacillus xinjiangensis]